jgi:flagellar hook-basal body complex protein FliE
MVEQNNAIGKSGFLPLPPSTGAAGGSERIEPGKDFKSLLMKSINEVNRLQNEADQATVNLATGATDNVAEVFTAVKKAELAFQTLLQIRNKLMESYDEIKQMRI